jgi:hypothetical protein
MGTLMSLTKPNDHGAAPPVDSTHDTDLMKFFFHVRLIDTYSVRPVIFQHALGAPQMLQASFEAAWNTEFHAINDDLCSI